MLPKIHLHVLMSLVIAGLLLSCKSSKSASVKLESGEIKRVGGCHIKLDYIIVHPKALEPLAYFTYVCNVEEAVLKTKTWWGTQPEPLLFPMAVGDCTRLEKTFYCVEEMNTSDATVTLEATYEQYHSDGALLKRVK